MGGFEGKVVLITGGGSGIGRAAALAFAKEGAKVAAVDIAISGGEETVRMIREKGGDSVFIEADISRTADVESMVNRTVSTLDRLDFAFNSAGVLARENAPIADCSIDEWERVLSTNLKGVFLCMKFELRQMRAQGKGAIVNTASTHGMVGAGHGISPYVASKHGVVGLTKAAALEYAQDGIRINAVCPGHTETALIENFISDPDRRDELIQRYPLGRLGTPEEVAAAVLWLCSDSASFVTGHAMAVDGGFLAQ